MDPEKIIYPHLISCPLNLYQRLEYLRYHMNRRFIQIKNKTKISYQERDDQINREPISI
jgi:hypothetical protein